MHVEERFQSTRTLKELSTFGIGGPIRHYFSAHTTEYLIDALQWAISHQIPYFILGMGSNCLFDDRGFNGLIIHNKINFCSFDTNKVSVGAGYSFARLGAQSSHRSLSGLEFASGIPGSVGGAVYMNAGSNGRETRESLQEVEFLSLSGEKKVYPACDLSFGYRHSSFQSMQGIILSAHFLLTPNPDARKIQQNMIFQRKKTQPLDEKSAGCIFRNPSKEMSAGALIDSCHLKGYCLGGAKVSEVHANFIVNASGASQADVVELIAHVQEEVMKQTGIRLEPEVRMVPYQ